MFDRRTIILLAIVATVILGLLLYMNQLNRNTYDWSETYQVSSLEPYGASAFHGFVQSYFDGETFLDVYDLNKDLPDYTEYVSNYCFLGYGLALDSTKAQRLLDFVADGNNALIAARFIPADFVEQIIGDEDCEFDYGLSYSNIQDTLVRLSTIHPKLKNRTKFKYIRDHKASFTEFQYVDWYEYCRDEARYLELGYINDSSANFVRVQHGEGYFYFHTTPFVFSNYYVLEKRNRQYANKILAHLDEGTIYYDRQNNVPYAPQRIDQVSNNNNSGSNGF